MLKKAFILLLIVFFVGTIGYSESRIKGFWNDSTITFKIKSAFYRSPIVSAWRIGVKTKKRIVTLYGRAKTKEEKEEAERIARSFRSVKDVINKIEVKTSRPSEIFKTTKEEKRSWWRKISDYTITGQVKTAFMFNKNLRPLHIDIITKNGVVFLEGRVPSKNVKKLAEEVANGVLGVKKVENLLKINNN
jgi:hyperosmotically inducible protein